MITWEKGYRFKQRRVKGQFHQWAKQLLPPEEERHV